MRNKWVKWATGFGSISVFTLFLQSVTTTNETVQEKEDNLINESTIMEQQQEQLSVMTIEEREQQLMSLDWTEGNWDVNYGENGIIATPHSDTTFLDSAEQRTRRS